MANVVVIYVNEKAYSHDEYTRILMDLATAKPENCVGMRLLEYPDKISDDEICSLVFIGMNRMYEDQHYNYYEAYFKANPNVRGMCVGDRVSITRYDEKGKATTNIYRCSTQGWAHELPII